MAQQAAWASTDSALVDAYLDLAASDAGHAAEMQRRAFVVAEGRKSRILAESAARSDLPAPSGVSADLVKREATLLRRLTNMDAVALAEVASVLSPDASDSRAARARQRSVVLRRLTAVWCEIAATGPGGQKYAELRQGNRPTWSSLSQLAEQLGPDTALVSMHTSRQRTVVFVLRTGWSAPTVVSEDMDARRWGDVMDRFSQDVTSFDGTQERRETWLAEPVHVMRRTHSAAGDATRIVLAPDGILHALPWAVALRGANWTVPEGQTPALTTIPALGLMQFLMRSGPPPQLSLVVGDPRDDLPGAREEAVAVARALGTTALLGPDASRKALQAHLSTAGVVHLATHAVFDPEAPLESYIELSDGNYLAREVVESRMVADLVTLSGCESGLSRPLAGEELAGLAYAFLYSGAKALLVSLWQVHDPATALLMSTFYAALQADVDRATALQSAMDDVRANGEYGHTYFWGAFTLVGAF
jgi:CHAT domain-containing protein